MLSPLFVLLLCALLSESIATPQKITACDCDGSPDQMWNYPLRGEAGFVEHLETGRCWGAVANDGCDWGGGGANYSCVELSDREGCGTAAALWNVTSGFNASFVTFRLVNPSTNNLCVDWNSRLAILEL